MKISIFPAQAIQELGRRDNQEDALMPAMGQASEATRVFVVCDGMGGHERGEAASGAVTQALGEFFDQHAALDETPLTDQLLAAALDYAYQQLDTLDDGGVRSPGTTLTLLALHRGGASMAHIGDSRIYHVRPADGSLRYRSRDHSLVMELFQSGEITEQEMHTHPQHNVITRAMQPGAENRVAADIVHTTDIQPGDIFLLCSDGLVEQMDDATLVQLLCSNDSDTDKRRLLLEASSENADNHSAYLIHIAAVTPEPTDATQPNDAATARCNIASLLTLTTASSQPTIIPAIPTPAENPITPPIPPVAPLSTPPDKNAPELDDAPATKKRSQRHLAFLIVILLSLLFALILVII